MQLTYLQETFPLKQATVFYSHPLTSASSKPETIGNKYIWSDLSGDTYITCQYRNTLSTVIIHLPDIKQCESTIKNNQHITCKN